MKHTTHIHDITHKILELVEIGIIVLYSPHIY